MALANKKLPYRPSFFQGVVAISVVSFISFLVFWGYGVHQDLAIIEHLENKSRLNRQEAGIHVNGYDWFSRRVNLDIHTGTLNEPRPLHKDSLDLLRRIRLGGIVFSGDSINRKDFSDFLELDAKYVSFFFEKIEGNSALRVPRRSLKRVYVKISGLNEQDVISLAEKISAENMDIRGTTKKYISSGTFSHFLKVNRSKNIGLEGFEIFSDNDNNPQFLPGKNSKHCYQSIMVADCSPLDEVVKVVKEIRTDELMFYSSTLDCEDFFTKLSLYQFDHAKSVIAKIPISETESRVGVRSYSVK